MGLEILDNLDIGSTITFNPALIHPDYDDMLPEWEKCRDCYGGEKKVKAKGQTYLPMLEGQTGPQYESYKNRGQFYGATKRTIEAYLGMIFRKPVTFKAKHNGKQSKELDAFIKNFLNRIAIDGKDLNEFAHTLTEETIVVSRTGVLVDFPVIDTEVPLSLKDYEDLQLQPTLSIYKAESILNWYCVKDNSEDIPVLFVLYEPHEGFATGSLQREYLPGYRILYLENYEDRANRRYKMIKIESSVQNVVDYTGLKVTDITYPMIDGQYLNYIPFYVISDQGLDYNDVRLPMIADLCNVNLGHYRNSCDLENELHFVSLKTIVFPGWDVKTYGQPRIGGALGAPRDCIPQLLEPTSDSSIREEMILKEARLAVLGAERISQKQRYLPSASVAEITASTESSVIQNLLTSLNLALNRVIATMIKWSQSIWPMYRTGKVDVEVFINTDLADNALTGADLVNFIAAFQQGGVSFETLYYNLERREIYPMGWTQEKEWEAIKATQDLILQSATSKIVAGEKGNPFFRSDEEDSDGGGGREKKTATGGLGEDVIVAPKGTSARVRIS